jgi:hypothetical protein
MLSAVMLSVKVLGVYILPSVVTLSVFMLSS